MNLDVLSFVIVIIARIFMFIIIANVIFSYFLSPYHPIREALDRIVEPFLTPIRNLLPQMGAIDFSPMILLFSVQMLLLFVTSILSTLR